MRARHLFALTVLLVCASGCFVWEELEEGEQELDRYSARPSTAEAPASTPAASPGSTSDGGSPRQRLDRWWQQARSLGPREDGDDLVRCRLDGTTRFTRAADCRAQGGRTLD